MVFVFVFSFFFNNFFNLKFDVFNIIENVVHFIFSEFPFESNNSYSYLFILQ
jgi:hypothetical protein